MTDNKNTKYFIGVKEAINLIGRLKFDAQWKDADTSDPDDDMQQKAARLLVEAIQSRKVVASIHRFDGIMRLLRPDEAAGEFFKVDVTRDGILLDGLPDSPLALAIDRKQLVAFMSPYASQRAHGSNWAADQCKKLMIEDIKAGRVFPPKAEHFEENKKKFRGLKYHGYTEARRKAYAETGTTPRQGRPPSKPNR